MANPKAGDRGTYQGKEVKVDNVNPNGSLDLSLVSDPTQKFPSVPASSFSAQ